MRVRLFVRLRNTILSQPDVGARFRKLCMAIVSRNNGFRRLLADMTKGRIQHKTIVLKIIIISINVMNPASSLTVNNRLQSSLREIIIISNFMNLTSWVGFIKPCSRVSSRNLGFRLLLTDKTEAGVIKPLQQTTVVSSFDVSDPCLICQSYEN